MNANPSTTLATGMTPTGPDDATLVAGIRAADGATFERLVRTHGGRMLAVARRILRNEEDARDAVQDALLQALERIGSFEQRAALSTWLHRIVVNAALMRLRTASRRRESSIDAMLPAFLGDGHRAIRHESWADSADELASRRETRELVRRCMDRLPCVHRTILILRDVEGLDTDETARCLNVLPGAVKTRLHRARMALREMIEAELAAG